MFDFELFIVDDRTEALNTILYYESKSRNQDLMLASIRVLVGLTFLGGIYLRSKKKIRMEPDVSFVGVKLLPGKLTNVGGSVNPESSIWTIHITQFALAAGAKPGKNTITLMQSDGESFALGTLEKDRCEQFQVTAITQGLTSAGSNPCT